MLVRILQYLYQLIPGKDLDGQFGDILLQYDLLYEVCRRHISHAQADLRVVTFPNVLDKMGAVDKRRHKLDILV